MAKNLIYDACTRVEVVAGANRASGAFVREDGWNGIVYATAASGESYTLVVSGVAEVSLAAVSKGDLVYITSAGALTKTAAGNTLCGRALTASAAVTNKFRMCVLQSMVVPAATQAASVAANVADLVTDFNALLTKLKAANLML